MRLTRPLLIFPYISSEDSEVKRATILTKFYNDICEYYERKEVTKKMAIPREEDPNMNTCKSMQPMEFARDNWKHRSAGMQCTSCMFFVKKESDRAFDGERGPIGRCRKHAPTLGGWPVIFAMDWCGDHKLDENKL